MTDSFVPFALSTTPFTGNDDTSGGNSNEKTIPKIDRIDWELLRKQKDYLAAMASDKDRLTSEIKILDGVIALIDYIQDDAVSHGKATEHEVFGMMYVIYSPNESAISDSAGFWSNEDGWTTIDCATNFTESEKNSLNTPIATGGDAKWIPIDALDFSRFEQNNS
jgi:hypothetical protein